MHAALNAVEMGLWRSHLENEVITEMRTRQFVGRLESLVRAVLFIESKIDPTGKTNARDHETAIAFLTKIGGDPDRDLGRIWNIRVTARKTEKKLNAD